MLDVTDAALAHASTHQFYEAKAESFFERTVNVPRWVQWRLEALLPHLVPAARVLDVGCGYGKALAYLPRQLHRGYVGVDVSSRMIDIARREYPEYDFRVGDACDLLTVAGEKFDLFLAIMVFGHVGPAHMPRALNALRSVLNEGALGLITTYDHSLWKLVTHEDDPEDIPEGLMVLSGGWDQESLEPLLESSGFRALNFEQDYSNGCLLHSTVMVR